MADKKLTPELIEEIERYIRGGLSRERAFKAASVPKAVSRSWLKRALNGETAYAAWLTGVEEAEAAAESTHVEKITESTDWRAHAWYLERVYPERYGQKIQLEVRQEVNRVLDAVQAEVPVELYEKILERVNKGEGHSGVDSGGAPGSPPVEPDQLN